MKLSELAPVARIYFGNLLSPYTDKIYTKYELNDPLISSSDIRYMRETLRILREHYHLKDADILEMAHETRSLLKEEPHIQYLVEGKDGYLTQLGRTRGEITEILEFSELFRILLETPQKMLAFSQAVTSKVKDGTFPEVSSEIDRRVAEHLKRLSQLDEEPS